MDKKSKSFALDFLAPPAGLVKIKRLSIVLSNGVRQSTSKARRVDEPMLCDTRLGRARSGTGDIIKIKRFDTQGGKFVLRSMTSCLLPKI
jgi:hypothetical protein